MLYVSDEKLSEGHADVQYVKWPVREMKHCHHYLKTLHTTALLPFVGGPNPASLLLICDL